jgi:hypothetical protein
MSSFGPPQAPVEEACPEYTLLSEKVVFVIAGKSSKEFFATRRSRGFSLSEERAFHSLDDERKESKSVIKEMTLRCQWEMIQRHIEEELKNVPEDPDSRHASAARD